MDDDSNSMISRSDNSKLKSDNGDDPMNVKHIVGKLGGDGEEEKPKRPKPENGLPKHLDEANDSTEFLLLSL